MIVYTGIDLIEILRIERAVARWRGRFLARVFTAGELTDCGMPTLSPGGVASLAARWAAKEAAAKALGVGLRGLGGQVAAPEQLLVGPPVGWHEIEVRRSASGRPILLLHGTAASAAATLGITTLAVSLSHTHQHAIASVVATG
jgi:holo-[acyl-carrier protein] synthase